MRYRYSPVYIFMTSVIKTSTTGDYRLKARKTPPAYIPADRQIDAFIDITETVNSIKYMQ